MDWTNIFTLGNDVFNGYNKLVYDGTQTSTTLRARYRYVRFYQGGALTSSNNACQLAEIKFTGFMLSSNRFASLNDVVCPVSVDGVALTTTKVNYKVDYTPEITSISPEYGSAYGGELITIDGLRFSSTLADNSVTIDGVACVVQTAVANKIECLSGPGPQREKRSIYGEQVVVSVSSYGGAFNPSSTFRYVEKWSDRNSWGCGNVPVIGDLVHVP